MRNAPRFLTYIVLFLFSVSAYSKTASEVFSIASKSTVVVLAYNSENELIGFGSGVVVLGDIIATNCHVIEVARRIAIRYRGNESPADILHTDLHRDTCTITASNIEAVPASLGNSDSLIVGDRVYAIGAPQGFELSLSEGLVSNLREMDEGRHIQTTAAISPGSSGGGLFNEDGQLVGLTTYFITEGQNLNFAVPVNWISELPDRHTAREVSDANQLEWHNKARTLESDEDWDLLKQHATLWVEADPDSADSWFFLGIGIQRGRSVHYVSNNVSNNAEAIEAFSKAVQLDPEYEEAWQNLGKSLTRALQYEKASQAYREAIHLNPQNPSYWIELGKAYQYNLQNDLAIGAYKQGILVDPTYAIGWISLGDNYRYQSQYGESLNAYREGLLYNNQDVRLWKGVGHAHLRLKNYSQAVEAYRQALKINPQAQSVLSELGAAYNGLRRYDQAIIALKQATTLNSQDPFAWYELGLALRHTNQTGELKDIYNRLLEMHRPIADLFFEEVLLR